MSVLYVTEDDVCLQKSENQIVIKRDRRVVKSIPFEKIEGVVLVGRASITTPLIIEFLERDVPLTWLSHSGNFYGRLEPTTGINIQRQREQFRRGEDESFCLELSRSFINAKIRNSSVLLRRYARNVDNDNEDVGKIIDELNIYSQKAKSAGNTEQLMGYEGTASRLYFKALGHLVIEDFKFSGRTRRPPTDPFNSLLSFGYTLLLYEIFTAVANKGLNPYAGFLHKIKRGHPALASDLIEEWRPVIVESLVMNLVQNNMITLDDFEPPETWTNGVFLKREAARTFIQKFENKIRLGNNYLDYVDYKLSFRESLQFQAGALAKAVENNDPSLYRPVLIR